MSVFIGNPAYSPVNGYAEIQGDMSVVNSTVHVTEGKVLKLDGGYAFCMIAKGITDMSKADSFKADTPVCWIAHSKEYTRWTKDNPKTVTQPTELETTLIQWLESDGSQWLEKSFKGELHLNGSSGVLHAVKKNNFWDALATFTECEPSLVKDLAVGSSSGKRGGGSGQTEQSRLADRLAFITTNVGAYGEKCTNLSELAFGLTAMKSESPEAYDILMQLLAMTVSR